MRAFIQFTRMLWRVVKPIILVVLFLNIGSLLGGLDRLLTEGEHGWDYLLASLPAACLASVAALISWNFRSLDVYWKALAVCIVINPSWLLFLTTLNDFVPDNFLADHGLDHLTLILEFGVEAFATFAFVIRAMIARSGLWAGMVFIFLCAAIPAIPFFTAVISYLIDSGIVESGSDYALMLHAFRYSIWLGLCMFAALALPVKSTTFKTATVLVESR
jgi:hypothetical protein